MVLKRLIFGRKVKVIAHRGASAYAPGNSMESFLMAVKLHADMIELDVRMTKDKKLVVIHDPKINKVTNKWGKVSNLTLKQIKTANLKNGEKLLTLDEALKSLGKKVKFNIEIKSPGIERRVIKRIKKYGLYERAIISSFKKTVLRKIRELDSGIRTGLITFRLTVRKILLAKRLGCYSIHPRHKHLRQVKVDLAHITNLMVYPWTVDKPMDINRLIDLSVDGIITDAPDVTRKIIRSQKVHKDSFLIRLIKGKG